MTEYIKPGNYRHYQGNTYRVIGIAEHSQTAEKLVVCQDMSSSHEMVAEPIDTFLESIEHMGERVSKFSYIWGENDLVDRPAL